VSDSDFVDVGDELVVSIGGFPVAEATVFKVDDEGVHVGLSGPFDYFVLPLNIKEYDQPDGYGHGSQPLDGTVTATSTFTKE
jgi:hypothetical protein